ncbi:serine hydrolase [Leptospira sp. 201903070]|uniref:Serine hydrolase n=1 Tax=Leptospira ainlahdjerensis TaxID=2810033 RepID=A0ABS2UBF1_9LEPT|nr:serine hydrolase [Leptospira ainlahdjerensis]MBM9577129.1 serine hydrolase [Leptospira ainlahdjerensis]
MQIYFYKRKRNFLILAGVFFLSILIFFYADLKRLYEVIFLFNRNRIVHNFRNMNSMFESRTIRRGDSVFELQKSESALPRSFLWNGEEKDIQNFLNETWTTGFIILKDDRILHESYYRGNDASTRSIVWSVTKSILSALLGIAFHENQITDLHTPITKFLPELKNTGYDDVPIEDLLHMTSGIRFNEDYGDFNSDINRMGRTLAFRTPMKDFIMTLRSERPPGTYRHYVSMDTQVLGMLLENITKENLSRFLEEKIWRPAGMESDAYWLIDGSGKELGFAMLNVTLRDMARFGLLYLNEGNVKGKQIVPKSWVRASVSTDAPILKPGKNPQADISLGYGYQWWIPEKPEGDYFASGVYNQFIYVNPKRRIVIAKTSAYPDYTKDGFLKEQQTHALFQELARKLGR